jgi:hypothetical protein
LAQIELKYKEHTMNYFAYANLMDIDTMRAAAPSAKVVTVACLKDYEFAFGACPDPSHHGARLAPVKGSETWGVQYELSEDDKAALDKLAGVAKGDWANKSVVLHTADGRLLNSTTYDIPHPSGPSGPPAHYVEPTLKGARVNQLPTAYIEKLERLLKGTSATEGDAALRT